MMLLSYVHLSGVNIFITKVGVFYIVFYQNKI
jgi:hypothetical protein